MFFVPVSTKCIFHGVCRTESRRTNPRDIDSWIRPDRTHNLSGHRIPWSNTTFIITQTNLKTKILCVSAINGALHMNLLQRHWRQNQNMKKIKIRKIISDKINATSSVEIHASASSWLLHENCPVPVQRLHPTSSLPSTHCFIPSHCNKWAGSISNNNFFLGCLSSNINLGIRSLYTWQVFNVI